LIVVALLAVATVFTLIPHRQSFITRMGQWTLVVYLCHGFVVRYLEYQGFHDWLPNSPWPAIAITVAVGIALALFIAWEPIARVLNYLVDPVNSLLKLRKRTTTGAGTR
jgi:fucose 4-O-acetylase-like acetyltransferase